MSRLDDLKKQRNALYENTKKIDEKITKEELIECEKEKGKYVGKYFTRKTYSDIPEYIRILSYVEDKGFKIVSVDVDNKLKETFLSCYVTYHLPTGLIRCSKKLFESKLKKALDVIGGLDE